MTWGAYYNEFEPFAAQWLRGDIMHAPPATMRGSMPDKPAIGHGSMPVSTPIPEPGSLALLAAGIVALAMARRG